MIITTWIQKREEAAEGYRDFQNEKRIFSILSLF
jgi:hypothetical protein